MGANMNKLFVGLLGTVALVGIASVNITSAIAAPEDTGAETRLDRICSPESNDNASDRAQRRIDRTTRRLNLTDAQKAALKDLQDARAKARSDSRTALCAKKPDLTGLDGRLAFRQAVLEQRLAEMKATTPKLLAFYNSLDADQKSKFDESRDRRRGQRHNRHGRHRHREND
jgi:Spy/CpxP family protein refolding chaperone